MKKPALIIGIGADKGPPVGPVPPGSSDGGDGGDGEDKGGDGKIYVPLASLATPDQGERMNTPEVGDSGSMQVDYTVESIEGDQACIKPTAVNGNPLPDADDTESAPEDQTDKAEGESPETSAMGDQLRQQAGAMSQ
jgi:hypothetical protein